MKRSRRINQQIKREIDDQIYSDELMYEAITPEEIEEEEYNRQLIEDTNKEIAIEYQRFQDGLLYGHEDDYWIDLY